MRIITRGCIAACLLAWTVVSGWADDVTVSRTGGQYIYSPDQEVIIEFDFYKNWYALPSAPSECSEIPWIHIGIDGDWTAQPMQYVSGGCSRGSEVCRYGICSDPPVYGYHADIQYNYPVGALPVGSVVEYAISFNGQWFLAGNDLASASGPSYVGSGYQNFQYLVARELQWLGNTYHRPLDGEIDPNDNVWISCETWPQGAATLVEVVYTIDDGATWWVATLTSDGPKGANDGWHVNLGTFQSGTTIEYAVVAEDPYGTKIWDSNDGADYSASVNLVPLEGLIRTYHWPLDGDLDPADDFWVNCETWPAGAATLVEAVYTIDDGATWLVAPLTVDGPKGSNDGWHVNLGKFTSGTTIRYAVVAEDANGTKIWDSNNGADYTALVNESDPVQWVGNTYHWPLDGDIEHHDNLWINTESSPLGTAVAAEVVYTTDGGANWQVAQMSGEGPVGNNDGWYVDLGMFPAGTVVQYAVVVTDGLGKTYWDNNGGSDYSARVNFNSIVHSPENCKLTSADDLLITFETEEIGYALVEVSYSVNGGAPQVAEMALTAEADYDHWEVNLGAFGAQFDIQYALAATDASGQTRWFNNGGSDYVASVDAEFVNQVPILTGPSSSVTRSSVYTNAYGQSAQYEAWHAFDRTVDLEGRWLTEHYRDVVTPEWIAYAFDEPKVIEQYTITAWNIGSFELQGFDGAEWISLDVRVNEPKWYSGLPPQKRSYRVANPGSYSEYRLYVTDDTDGNGDGIDSYIILYEWTLESKVCTP